MRVEESPIKDLFVINPNVIEDHRGYFYESFNQKLFDDAIGYSPIFVQDNQSRSSKGVLRGMHFQFKHPQAQIVTVMRGSIFDVGVDLRPHSKSFGKWFGVELSDYGQRQVYMAPGIAHGFCVLSDFADLHYKVSRFYDHQDERGLLWNDPKVNISWPKGVFTINERDANYPLLSELIDNNQLPSLEV